MKVFGHCQVLVSILLIFRVLTLGSKSQSEFYNGYLICNSTTARDGRSAMHALGKGGIE